jgi:hypothetical protein
MIYVIQVEGTQFYKIGYTQVSAKKRRQSLQVGNQNKLIIVASFEGNKDKERAIHQHLASYATDGEWFNLPDKYLIDSLETIESVPKLASGKARLTIVIDDNSFKEFSNACKANHSDISKTIRLWVEDYVNGNPRPYELSQYQTRMPFDT